MNIYMISVEATNLFRFIKLTLGTNLSLLKHHRHIWQDTQSIISNQKKSKEELNDFAKPVESESSFPKIGFEVEGIK